jgi:hypothetical protein
MSRKSCCWLVVSDLIVLLSVCSPLGSIQIPEPIANATAAQDAVLFDVPALLEAKEIRIANQFSSINHRLVAITVPVTSQISPQQQGDVQAFRFEVFWNRNPFPITDYAPRTQTFSEIAGTIEIDRSREKKSSYEFNLSGQYPTIASGKAHLNGSGLETESVRFSEIPQHEVLVAAGTVRRGTGAFFRFHPSRAETLEGGRDLLLTFRVPQSWRGGVLQVECTAIGSRRYLGWREPFEFQRGFIVPVFLENDEEAEQVAMEFTRQEQQLRQSWQRFKSREQASRSSTIEQWLGIRYRPTSKSILPEDWVYLLIQSTDQPLKQYRQRLPIELAEAADGFVQSRSNLLKLSR